MSKRAFQITHHDYSVLSCKNYVGNIRSHDGDVNEKVAEKKTLHPVKVFRRYPKTPCCLKEGNLGWTGKKRGLRQSSDRHGRIYRLAIPVLN